MSAYGRAGTGDIIGCVKGRYVEIELKQPGKYTNPAAGLTPLQARHGIEVITNGGVYVFGDNWLSLKFWLESCLSENCEGNLPQHLLLTMLQSRSEESESTS